MTAWFDPWHLLFVPAVNKQLQRLKTQILSEQETTVLPVVQRQVIAGIRPFALKLGAALKPQIGYLYARQIALHIGAIATEFEYGNEGWEDRVATRLAKAALLIGSDRFDAALFAIAKWDLPQEHDRDSEDSPTQQTQVLDRPWPSNERLADGDY